MGQHTYCTVIMHFLIFRIIYIIGVLLKVYPVEAIQNLTPIGVYAQNGGWIIFSVITCITCFGIAWIAEKWSVSNYILNASLRTK